MKSWVGVDFDGTLVTYKGWQGPEHIGEPIPSMVEYVKSLLDAGVEVRIFTARAQIVPGVSWEEYHDACVAVENWCEQHLGQRLQVTASKEFGMLFAIDDRAYQVRINTGETLVPLPTAEQVLEATEYHMSSENPNSPTYGK